MRFIKHYKSKCEWRKWFAWYPVTAAGQSDYFTVWLEIIEKRESMDDDHEYEYRLIE